MGATYRVMLDGVAADRDSDEAAAHLARILHVSPETADGLLNSRGVVIKDGLDRDAAMRCRAVLERAGCIAVVNREISSTASTGRRAQPAAVSDLPDASADAPSASTASGSRATYLAIFIAIAVLIGIAVALPK